MTDSIKNTRPFHLYHHGCNISLLEQGGLTNSKAIKVTNTTNLIKTKYTFTMPKETFDKIRHKYFGEKKKSIMRETFYSLDLMKNNIWMKEITEFKRDEEKKYYDLKIVEDNREQENELKYLQYTTEKREEWKVYFETLETGFDFEQEISKNHFTFEFVRNTYQHLQNKEATLTVDKVYFQDGETFVVFSFECVVSEHDDTTDDLSPCRSKIIELISKTDENLKETYEEMNQMKKICNLKYISMDIAEYKFGKEKADERKNLAKEFIKELKDAGETDEKFLAMMYRQAVANGITQTECSEEDYF